METQAVIQLLHSPTKAVSFAYEHRHETFYCVGQIDKDASKITWTDAGVGRQLFNIPTKEPSISMNENGMVVAAAQGGDSNKIVFRVGYLESTILWREVDLEVSKDMSGSSPVVAINKNNCIISVYFSTVFRKLLMKFSTVNVDSKISSNGVSKAHLSTMALVCIPLLH